MNPESRVLKKITLDDIAEADRVFTMLMGDEVEPRRIFIETNAHKIMDTIDV
jgi:DNA gyrase subunit B